MARFIKSRNRTVGEAPGSIVFIGRRKMEATRFRLLQYSETDYREFETESVDELLQNFDKDKVNWVNIDGLHDVAVITKIGEYFKLSSLVLEDIANTDQRSKLIDGNGYLAAFVKILTFELEASKVHGDQISILLGSNYVISFQEEVGTFFNPIRERIRNNIGNIRKRKSDYLFYRLFDTITDHFMLNVSQIADLVEEIEENILTATDKETLENLYRNKTEISYLRKSIRPVVEITKILKSLDSSLISKTTRPYLIQLDDIVTHTMETVEIYSTMVSDQLVMYNTNLSNRSNEVMKVLTIFASIFIPLTFIVGVYGTNFDYIPELKFKISYFVMWGVMLIVTIIMLFYFRRKKWL